MMTQDEIAWLMFQLLQNTRTYRGDSFAYFHDLDDPGKIRHATALLVALPKSERLLVEASFQRITEAVAEWRVTDFLATHSAPVRMQ
jgi:hypothetical protein